MIRMKARDNLKVAIEALHERHGLLAAYFEAGGCVDWRALNKRYRSANLSP
jgi:hypothetical protein